MDVININMTPLATRILGNFGIQERQEQVGDLTTRQFLSFVSRNGADTYLNDKGYDVLAHIAKTLRGSDSYWAVGAAAEALHKVVSSLPPGAPETRDPRYVKAVGNLDTAVHQAMRS